MAAIRIGAPHREPSLQLRSGAAPAAAAAAAAAAPAATAATAATTSASAAAAAATATAAATASASAAASAAAIHRPLHRQRRLARLEFADIALPRRGRHEVGAERGALRPVVVQLQRYSAEAAKQVEEAASSVVRSVAEGQRRRGRDPLRFYAMAHGSANEVRGQLDVADAWGWAIDSEDARRVLDRELALLWGLTHPRPRSQRAAPANRDAQR